MMLLDRWEHVGAMIRRAAVSSFHKYVLDPSVRCYIMLGVSKLLTRRLRVIPVI